MRSSEGVVGGGGGDRRRRRGLGELAVDELDLLELGHGDRHSFNRHAALRLAELADPKPRP